MPRAKRKVNKSAFVRGLPDIPALEVVKKAAAQGITLSDKYVYNIRAKAKASAGRRPGRPGRPEGGRSTTGAGSTEERQLVDVALELGLSRAEALLRKLRSVIHNATIG